MTDQYDKLCGKSMKPVNMVWARLWALDEFQDFFDKWGRRREAINQT